MGEQSKQLAIKKFDRNNIATQLEKILLRNAKFKSTNEK